MLKFCLFLLLSLLTLKPISSHAESCSYQDADIKASQKQCYETPGREWNCTLHRCFTTEQAEGFQEDFAKCQEIAEPEERKTCTDNLAKLYSESEGIELLDKAEHKMELMAKGMYALQIIHVILAHTSSKGSGSCAPMKMYMMAGMMGLMNEFGNYLKLKDELKDLKDQYDKENAMRDGHSQQLRSFEFLAQYHDAVGNTAKRKKDSYMNNTAMYGTVAIMAGVSAFQKPDPCIGAGPEEGASGSEATPSVPNPSFWQHKIPDQYEKRTLISQTNNIKQSHNPKFALAQFYEANRYLQGTNRSMSVQEFKEFEKIKLHELGFNNQNSLKNQLVAVLNDLQNQFIPQSHAFFGGGGGSGLGGITTMMPLMVALGTGGNQAVNEVKGKFARAMNSSMGIAISAGIAATINGILFVHFKKIEKQAKDNANQIRLLANKFMRLATGDCGRRDNPGAPECYCLTLDQDINPEREDDPICQEWMDSFFKDKMSATNYRDSEAGAGVLGCMNAKGEFDRNCDCKKTDSCYKVPFSAQEFGDIGTVSSAATLAANANSVFSGNTATGNLTTSQLGKQAKRNFDTLQQLKSKQREQLKSQGKSTQLLDPAVGRALIKKTFDSGLLKSLPQKPLANSSSFAKSGKVALANKLLNRNIRERYSKQRQNFAATNPQSTGFKFNFGKNNKNLSGAKVQTFSSQKSYKLNKADININDDVSLFDILTNRYQKSGMKRLHLVK